MKVVTSCEDIAALIAMSAETALAPQDSAAIDEHVKSCAACRANVKRFRAMQGVLNGAFSGVKVSPDFAEKTGKRLSAVAAGPASSFLEDESAETVSAGLQQRFGGAPWWVVSCVLHVLVILLAGLISVSLELPKADDSVIMVTELQPRTQVKAEAEKPKAQEESALKTKQETPPTDPTSKEMSDVIVPPDILAKAELGDHFETINLDRPDTQSAFGNPDAQMFHSVQGNDEPEGGGGQGGMAGLEDMIGVGGAASAGSGGGWGGGNGTGIGTGNGSGRGSFGTRTGGGRKLMVKKHGGTAATETAVDRALDWLAKHQEPDGHWDSKKYGTTRNKADTAVTGLALLAFLGAGHTEKLGKHKDTVQRAVKWLISRQDQDGMIWDTTDVGHQLCEKGYPTAISTMALAEAAGMARVPETIAAAQKAVDYAIEKHQLGEGSEKWGWRYRPRAREGADISVTGWFVLALKSAKVAGLKVDAMAFEGAARFLNKLQRKVENQVDNGYEPASYYWYMTDLELGFGPPRTLNAIGNLCRLYMGERPEKLQNSVEHFVKTGGTPKWGDGKRTVDLYYWYYGTLCVFQQGGDIWKQWNKDLQDALVPSQCKDGDNAGSWDPIGAYSMDWGRVGQTALGALCLEVYYRYQKLNQ